MIIATFCLTACGNILVGDTKSSSAASSSQGKATPTFGGSASNIAKNSSTQEIASSKPKASQENGAYEITYSNAYTYTDSIGSVWLQVITEIQNTGTTDLYLSSGSYDIEDNSGKLIASEEMVSTYPDVISPGEKGYMYDETILDTAVEGELSVIPRPSVKTAKVDNTRLNVTDVEVSPGKYGGMQALGRVENTSNKPSTTTYIALVLFDENDTPLGLMFTILTDQIGAGEKRGFEISGTTLPDAVAEKAAKYMAYAYPWTVQF